MSHRVAKLTFEVWFHDAVLGDLYKGSFTTYTDAFQHAQKIKGYVKTITF